VSELEGRVILVTGATDGLGRAVALELGARGATVLVHGRDAARLDAVVAAVEHAGGRARPYRADFAALAEVRELADGVRLAEPRLDVILNNAGIGTTLDGDDARRESADGYELRFQVNYLAGFLLTRLLESLLPAGGRVVNVSSAGQMPLDFDDLMLEHGFSGVRAYCQSKLAQILFTFTLAERLAGRATANCLHPATYMPTKMVLDSGARPVSTLEEGVAATVTLAADPALTGVTGRYFNRTREARADEQAYDEYARARLWEVSEALVGL
jgi:NAD(P)-dependent dehydrogenase (short-subunit alcohol dehydrogenase family)